MSCETKIEYRIEIEDTEGVWKPLIRGLEHAHSAFEFVNDPLREVGPEFYRVVRVTTRTETTEDVLHDLESHESGATTWRIDV